MQQARTPQEATQAQSLEMTLREQLLAQPSGSLGSSSGHYPPPPTVSAPLPDNPYQQSDSASPQSHGDMSGLNERRQPPFTAGSDAFADDALGLDAKGKRELSTSKRAAQNRAAQRAFRQRKEGYIKKLEEQVSEFQTVEQSYRALQNENYQLREYIIGLQSRLLESHSAYPTPPAHLNLDEVTLISSPAVDRPSSTEQQLRRDAQQNAAPTASIATGPEPLRQPPIDHLGAAAARAETPYGLGSEHPSKRVRADPDDSTPRDVKSPR